MGAAYRLKPQAAPAWVSPPNCVLLRGSLLCDEQMNNISESAQWTSHT